MIGRLVASGSVSAGAVSVAVSAPTIWTVLGYSFEAGSMIAALTACAAVRLWMVQKDAASHRWAYDAPISVLAILFTAAAVIKGRPDPLSAIAAGTGFGVVGAGLIGIAKKYVDRMLHALGVEAAPAETGKDGDGE